MMAPGTEEVISVYAGAYGPKHVAEREAAAREWLVKYRRALLVDLADDVETLVEGIVASAPDSEAAREFRRFGARLSEALTN